MNNVKDKKKKEERVYIHTLPSFGFIKVLINKSPVTIARFFSSPSSSGDGFDIYVIYYHTRLGCNTETITAGKMLEKYRKTVDKVLWERMGYGDVIHHLVEKETTFNH